MSIALPNPSPCCGIKTECCLEKLPEVLVATIQSLQNCPGLNGIEVPLVLLDRPIPPYGPMWDGSSPNDACGTMVLAFALFCNPSGISGFSLYTSSPFSFSWTLQSGSSSCDPLSLVFRSSEMNIFHSDCCDANPVQLEVTITA